MGSAAADKVAEVPADGLWHELPERPVNFIEASLIAQIDIDAQGVGRVQFPKGDGRLIEVRYG